MAYVWTPGVGYQWHQETGQAPATDVEEGGFTPAGAPVGIGTLAAPQQFGVAAQAALGPQYMQRPGVERYVQSIENPMLGAYYMSSPYTEGVGEQVGSYGQSYGDWLGGPAFRGGGGAVPGAGTSLIRGGATGMTGTGGIVGRRAAGRETFGELVAVARALQAGQDASALDPTGQYQDLLSDPAAVAAIGSLGAYDPNYRGAAGQMRQAGIQRRMAPWSQRNPEATEGDWLAYLASVLPGSYNVPI